MKNNNVVAVYFIILADDAMGYTVVRGKRMVFVSIQAILGKSSRNDSLRIIYFIGDDHRRLVRDSFSKQCERVRHQRDVSKMRPSPCLRVFRDP